ncbi:MAG: phosphate ABC transporter substrate-binding protein PstS [Gallionella sp.]|nr:phosphate ABC transporter substrate-binding protein PstS [Gallionella sp.]
MMNNLLKAMLLISLLGNVNFAQSIEIKGAGATFPAPLYAKWAEAYRSKTGIAINYQAVGSEQGIQQISDKAVDFGASDIPLSSAELKKKGLIQFPATVGGVVPVINVEGIASGTLKLDGATLGDIYIGKITQWNDPAIAALNKGVTLPNRPITVVHQSFGSGTSFIFGQYLAEVSTPWKALGNKGTASEWKTGQHIGRGNKAVVERLRQSGGGIAYVEYAYAAQNNLNIVQLKNRDGQFVKAHSASFKAAAANAEWEKSSDFYQLLVNKSGKEAWPITSATFILMHKTQDQALVGKEILQFFNWAYLNGQGLTAQLEYVHLPNNVISLIQLAWKAQLKDSQGNPL